jgi:muramidase (phage lysozyme)
MAVALIELREALGYVRKGEIAKAINKLNTEWPSLPGGTENAGRRTADKRPMNMSYFEELFDSYLVEEKKKAGVK